MGQGISDSERQVIPDWSALAGNITSGDGWLAGSTPFYLTQCGGLACSNPTGSFNYQLYLDFATGKVGGNGSSAYVVAADDVVSIWDSVTIGGGVFKDLAAFYPAGQARVSAASDSGNLIADFTLTNVDSVGALAAEVGAVFNDGSTQGYGRATDGVTGAPFITPSSWVDVTAAAGGGTGQYASGPRPFTLAQCNAGPCGAGPHGTFDFTLSVDFVAQAYNLDANLNIADSNLDNVQYPGQVISQSLNVADDFGTPVAPQIVGSSGSGFGIEVTVNNAGLSPAALADGHATFDDTPFVGGAALPSLGSGMADNVPLVIPPF
ncbi:MAG: hypothetical protein HZB91_11250 [Elusimicrobia bacterium]|nr:hypothetical protein [Elusimicrobiota bacterium]